MYFDICIEPFICFNTFCWFFLKKGRIKNTPFTFTKKKISPNTWTKQIFLYLPPYENRLSNPYMLFWHGWLENWTKCQTYIQIKKNNKKNNNNSVNISNKNTKLFIRATREKGKIKNEISHDKLEIGLGFFFLIPVYSF